jgi:hypothetical protein
VGIHVDPLFDPIRAHPRFKEVESRVGIPTTRGVRREGAPQRE